VKEDYLIVSWLYCLAAKAALLQSSADYANQEDNILFPFQTLNCSKIFALPVVCYHIIILFCLYLLDTFSLSCGLASLVFSCSSPVVVLATNKMVYPNL
jgi:hypothetical protein